MKILIFSDIHATKDSALASRSKSSYTRYQEILLDSFGFVQQVAKEVDPDYLVFGGDCFHSPDYVDTRSLNVVGRGFSLLSELQCTRYALVGNHDIYASGPGIHSLEFLRSDWEVIDQTRTIGVAYAVGLVPFSKTADVDLPESDIMISHLDIIGSVRRAIKSGTDVKALSDSGLDPLSLQGYKVVFNGHYHNPGFLEPCIHNVGSLLCRDFSDKGSSPRGVTIWDSESGVRFIENPHAEYFNECIVSSEDDVMRFLEDESLGSTHLKIYFDEALKDYVDVLAESAAGSWLYPIVAQQELPQPQELRAEFSLEHNLSLFIQSNYGDAELEKLGLEVLNSVGSSTEFSSRSSVEVRNVEIHGYQSIKDATVDLYRKGLILLRGENHDSSDPSQSDNGSGKSSLIEAIHWCWTGKSLRGYTGSEVISWGADSCYVATELEIGGKLFTQVRSRKDPVLGTGSRMYAGGLDLLESDSSISARTMRAADKQFCELLGRNEKLLKQLSFMSLSGSGRFSALGYDRRTRLIEDILGAYPYKLAQEKCNSEYSRISLELAELRGLRNSQDTIAANARAKLAEIQVAFERLAIDSKNSRATRVKGFESKRALILDQLESVELSRQELIERLPVLRKKISSYEQEVSSLLNRKSVLDGDVKSLQSEVARIEACRLRHVCPECGEPTDHRKLDVRMAGVRAELVPCEREAGELLVLYRTRSGRLSELRYALDVKESSIATKEFEIKKLRAELNELEAPLAEARAEASVLVEKRAALDADFVNFTTILQTVESEIEITSAEVTAKQDLLTSYLRLASVFDEAGIRSEMIAKVAIPFLNVSLANSSQSIVGRTVSLSSSRELKSGRKKNEIDIVEEGQRTYRGDSDGEKARVDFCVQLALNDLAAATGRSKFGFLAIDEALSSMDSAGLQAVCSHLERAADLTVLLTTHSVPPVGTKVWTAIKEHGETRIETYDN